MSDEPFSSTIRPRRRLSRYGRRQYATVIETDAAVETARGTGFEGRFGSGGSKALQEIADPSAYVGGRKESESRLRCVVVAKLKNPK